MLPAVREALPRALSSALENFEGAGFWQFVFLAGERAEDIPMDVSDAPRHFGRRARMGRALSAVRGFTNALGAARDTLLPRAAAPIRSLGTARALTTHAGRGTLPWTTRVDDVLVSLSKSTAVQNLHHRPQGVFTKGFAAEAGSLKVYKPTSPGQRGRITTTRDHLWKGKPFKALTVGLRKKGGRNNQGRISVWHKGGGHKQLYRVIDMKRRATTAAGTVRRIEYDPNRSTRIALVGESIFIFTYGQLE